MLQSAGGRQCARAEGLLGLPCINHRGSYWAYVEQAIQLARLASWPPKTETGLPLHCLPNAAKYVVQGSRIPVVPLPRAAAVRRSFRFICAFQKGSQLCCVLCAVLSALSVLSVLCWLAMATAFRVNKATQRIVDIQNSF